MDLVKDLSKRQKEIFDFIGRYRLPLTVEVQWFEWLPGYEELGG